MLDAVADYLAGLDWKLIGHKGFYVVLILVLAWIALRVVRTALRRFERYLVDVADDYSIEASKRAETLTRLVKQAAVVAIWLIALFTILSELGVDMGPILASAGIVGLAVGFGAQSVVRDVISGFFLILEDQIRVGDVAVINGTGGLVEQVRLRTVVLRDLSGTVHVFANGTITTLANMTKTWSAYVFEIGVAYKEDTDRVVEIMKEVGTGLRQDDELGPLILEDLEVLGVDKLADSAVIIKGRIKTKPINQWTVGREYLRRLKKAFDEKGVEIPYPHRAIYFGEASKPFVVQVLEKQAGPAPAAPTD